jgi:hypothetical protein
VQPYFNKNNNRPCSNRHILNDVDISDHRSILTSIKTSSNKQQKQCLIEQKYVDYEKTTEKLKKLTNDNSLAFDDFHHQLSQEIANDTKTMTKQISYLTLKKPWFSKEHTKIKKIRDKFYKLSKKHPIVH